MTNCDIKFYPHFEINVDYFYNTRFAEGASAYIIVSAKRGKLERIVIKKLFIHFKPYLVSYNDTTNATWLERELCSQQEALNYMETYYGKKAQEAIDLETGKGYFQC